MPIDTGYAITDLASLAGVTPRTIRYYVSVGLVPAPTQAGRAARYGDDHLARIRLIRRLQEQHLPLAEIRARLASLSDTEITEALHAPEPRPAGSALDYIRSLTSGARHRTAASPAAPSAQVPAGLTVASAAGPSVALPTAPQAEVPAAPPAVPQLHPAPASRSSTRPVTAVWERIPLAPDVELHVRRPLSRTAHKRVERLITIAREILEDQP
jgi:DNA-binding transcriptional MerR regulator